MTKFNTVREYMNIKTTCDFCGSASFGPTMVGKKRPNHIPSYNMTFDQTTFHTSGYRSLKQSFTRSDKQNSVEFSSDLTDNILNFYYSIGDSKNVIFSMDVDTNKVIGNIDRVQRVIWDHQLSIFLACQFCRAGYVSESSLMYLERKSGVILPIWMSSEAFIISIQEKDYALLHSIEMNSTILYSHEKRDIVKKLPPMPLHQISGKDNIINKIKTILVFS